MRLAIVLLCLCSIAPVASAQNYFPLNKDRTWQYQASFGMLSEVVLGPTVFHGASVTEVRALAGESLKYYYYSRNAEGDVFLHGTRESLVEIIYEPPMITLDMPLVVEKAWSQTLERRHFQNGHESHTVTVTTNFSVTSHETGKVQVGEFDCFAIQENLSGVALTNCYAIDVGKIKTTVNGDDLWELIDFDTGVPVDTTSWGAVKALYGSD